MQSMMRKRKGAYRRLSLTSATPTVPAVIVLASDCNGIASGSCRELQSARCLGGLPRAAVPPSEPSKATSAELVHDRVIDSSAKLYLAVRNRRAVTGRAVAASGSAVRERKGSFNKRVTWEVPPL